MLSVLAVLFYAVYNVSVSFPFGVEDVEFDCIGC